MESVQLGDLRNPIWRPTITQTGWKSMSTICHFHTLYIALHRELIIFPICTTHRTPKRVEIRVPQTICSRGYREANSVGHWKNELTKLRINFKLSSEGSIYRQRKFFSFLRKARKCAINTMYSYFYRLF